MAGPNLQINIGASVASAVQGLNQVGAAGNSAAAGLNNAGTGATNAGRGLNSLAPAIRPNLQGLTLLGRAGQTAGQGLSQVTTRAGTGAAALNDFNRVIQDAPFGLVGIGNNITQLSESFGRLVASSGGVAGAFRALFSSATGFAGIGLIISAITTALTFATVGFGAWTKGLNNSKKASDDAAKSLDDFLASLKSVDQVTAQSTGSVQGQIAQVQSLARVVNDTNQAYDVRNRALQELQQTNKAYFGTLKLEDAATGALTAKVNEYTKALVAQAVVKGFTDEISRLSKELFTQGLATDRARTKVRQLEDQLAKTPRTQTNLQGVVSQSGAYQELADKVAEAREEFQKQRSAEEQIATSRAQFNSALQKANIEALKFADISGKSTEANKKEEDALKQRIDALKELKDTIGLGTAQQRELVQLEVQLLQRDGVKLGFTPEEVKDRIDALIRDSRFGRELQSSPITIPIVIQPRPVIDVAGTTLEDGKIPEDYADKLNQGLNKAISNKIDIGPALQQATVDALAALGEGIGEVIAGAGDIGDVFAGVFQVIGAAMQQFGKALIAYAIAAKALQVAISNPFIAIAAGVALIAAGAALKKAIPGFADGVTGFAGGVALVGERGPELVRLPAGSDVIPNNRVGAALGTQGFIATSVLRGEDIYTSYRRVDGRKRRI